MAFTYGGDIDDSTMAYALGKGGGSNATMTLDQSLRNPNVQSYLSQYPERRNDVERYLTFNPGDGDRMDAALANDGQWSDGGRGGTGRRASPVAPAALGTSVDGAGYATAPIATTTAQTDAQTLQQLLLAALFQR